MKEIIAQTAGKLVEEIFKTIEKVVEASSIGDTFPFKRAVKGRCGDFRSKAKKILPDLDCGSLSV